jgi:hypothetical protein
VCRRKRFELLKTGSYFLPLRRSAQSRFAGIIQFAHSVHELSPKHPAEHADRQEEAWPGRDTLRVVGRQPTGWNNAAYVRVMSIC